VIFQPCRRCLYASECLRKAQQGSLRSWPIFRQLLDFVRQSVLLLIQQKPFQAFDELVALGHMLPLQAKLS
jgi:hypothetical protein